MRLIKPDWVSHQDKPIFSVDIHPDGSRFATGGQGDSSGKVVIWNMAPVRDEEAELNENCPRMLCCMDNHLACVNCVRWSHSGRFLASASDDKLVMIWQTSNDCVSKKGRYVYVCRHSGMSTVFGSGGSQVNHEVWRAVHTLRGHSGDVLDVAWSPHDVWLASCSVDNTIVVWNALKLPEQVSVIKRHTGLVKGVTWDPVGKYLASQSDDKTLRIWRTLDWQQEAAITEPFEECGGTTHVLRLNWSPDGQYVVSAHAMNNSGPVAQIIERGDWKTSMDFVGHRKAVTAVRFNPRLLKKRLKNTSEKTSQYTCCAIGSRDRSLSVWLTALRRPLVVTHDLFTSSILDVSWSQCGLELMCCSLDGTAAYISFTEEEIGMPLTQDETEKAREKLYGKSMPSKTTGAQIIESAAMLNILEKKSTVSDEKKHQAPPADKTVKTQPSSVLQTPTKGLNKQIETRTKDGKRRITPIFISPQPESLGEAPLPFGFNSEPTFSSSNKQSDITVEKRDSPPSSTWLRETSHSNCSPIKPVSTPSSKPEEKSKGSPSQIERISASKDEKERPGKNEDRSDQQRQALKTKPDTLSSPGEIPKKKDRRGRPRKDRTQELQKPATVTAPVLSQPPPAATSESYVERPRGLNLPVPRINKTTNLQISGTVGSDSALLVEIENGVGHQGGEGAGLLHQVRCVRGNAPLWSSLLTSRIIACAGNSHLVCVACADSSISLFASVSGKRLQPALMLDSRVSALRCSGFYVMAVTSKGAVYVWNINTMAAIIRNENLASVLPSSGVNISSCLLTEQGLPVITLTNGKAYTFKQELGCWTVLSCQEESNLQSSEQQGLLSSAQLFNGPLATLQGTRPRPSNVAARLFRNDSSLVKSASLSHLENQVACCLALKSSREYHFWLMAYVRYIVQEGLEVKIRELLDDLLGPVHRSRSSSKWESTILTHSKRALLLEILPIVGENISLQRIFTEYKDQLDLTDD